jgi:hypothetical protein
MICGEWKRSGQVSDETTYNARSAPYPFPLMPDALVTRISIVTTLLRRRLEGLATRRAKCSAGRMRLSGLGTNRPIGKEELQR